MDEVAVGCVYLNNLIACLYRPLCSLPEVFYQSVYVRIAERHRRHVVILKRKRRRGHCLPAIGVLGRQLSSASPRPVITGFTSGVSELDAGNASLRFDERCDLSVLLNVLIFPYPQVPKGYTPFR